MNGAPIVQELINSLTHFDGSVKNPLVLVAAHPRSGTQYMTGILRQMGLRIGHEYVEKDGAVSWFHILHKEERKFQHIFHQVRHPLDCISSSMELGDDFFDYIGKFTFVPEREEAPKLVRCAYSWLGWNQILSGMSEWQFQAEDIRKIAPELVKRLGLPRNDFLSSSSVDFGSANTKRDTVSWKDLNRHGLAAAVRKEAQKYGYSLLGEA